MAMEEDAQGGKTPALDPAQKTQALALTVPGKPNPLLNSAELVEEQNEQQPLATDLENFDGVQYIQSEEMAPSVTKMDRPEWALLKPDGEVLVEEHCGLLGPLKNAIMYSGIKDVQRLLQNGAPLIAEYVLESEGRPIGTTLDLVMLHKRFKLVMQMLEPSLMQMLEPPQPIAISDQKVDGADSEEAKKAMPQAEGEDTSVEPPVEPAGEEARVEVPVQPAGPPNTQGVELATAAKFAVAWAARDGRHEILDALIKLGASPVQCDESGRSALLLAASRGQRLCVDLLLAAGAWEQETGNKEEIVKKLTHFKCTVPASAEVVSTETPHALAVRLGLIKESQRPPEAVAEARWANTPHGRHAWPLRAPADKGLPEGQGPLERAIVGYGVKEVERIIGLGAPLTAEYGLDETGMDVGNALDLVTLSQRYNLAMQLLSGSEGGTLATLSRRAVARAAHEGKVFLLRELLRLGGTPGQCDASGRSALLLATKNGHQECVIMLLEASAWEVEGSRHEVLEWANHYKMPFFSPC